MSKLDPRIEAIRAKYDLSASDFWELPQKKGTWIAKHSALEIVAVKANITFDAPIIIESDTANGIAVMSVRGSFPSTDNGLGREVSSHQTYAGRSEWATGEASPKNNKNAYPWAMAEKRAKDRVVLKLSGIAGLVYSEDEADDFKEPSSVPQRKPVAAENNNPASEQPSLYKRLSVANSDCRNKDDFNALWGDQRTIKAQNSLTEGEYEQLEAEKATKFKELDKAEPSDYVPPSFDDLPEPTQQAVKNLGA